MGHHHVECMCGGVTAFSHDTMWIGDDGQIHDTEEWKCGHCGKVLKQAEMESV